MVSNRAFADHWGSTPIDQKAWTNRLQSFVIRTDLSWIALSGDQLISLSLNAHYPSDVEMTGRKDGWLMSLFTEPDYRNRGIASALSWLHAARLPKWISATLRSGWTVPTRTGHTGLRLCFHPMHRSVQHQIEV